MSTEHFNKRPDKVQNRSREAPMGEEKSSSEEITQQKKSQHKHDSRALTKFGTAFTLPTRAKAVDGSKSDRK